VDRAHVQPSEPAEHLVPRRSAARAWIRAFSEAAAFSVNVNATGRDALAVKPAELGRVPGRAGQRHNL